VYKIIPVFFIILFFSAGLRAQEIPDPKTVDAKTYALYSAGKWDELITQCEYAIDNGVDFFYLRLRAGIAFYRNKNYMSAIGHFEKALIFNPVDIVAMEYLYYSYLFSGRESDVLSLVSVMPLKLKKKLQVYSIFIYGFYTEGGYTVNKSFNDQERRIFLTPANIYSEQNIVNDATYLNLSLMHQLGKNIKVFHGYNNISVLSSKQIIERSIGEQYFNTSVKQDEYYLNINFRLGDGFDFITALHYLNVKEENVILKYNTSVNPPLPGYASTKESLDDFVTLFSLTKYAGHFRLGLVNSVSNMNKATQVQNTAQVIFYPLGNLDLYTVTEATLFSNREWGKNSGSSGILDQKIGWKFFDNLWMETGYTFGYIYNYSENNAFIIFNNSDRISNRLSVNLIAPVSNHIELSFRYQHYDQETGTYYYTSPEKYNIFYTNNSNHKLIGGLKWIF
jgi:hypothetical protein